MRKTKNKDTSFNFVVVRKTSFLILVFFFSLLNMLIRELSSSAHRTPIMLDYNVNLVVLFLKVS